MDDCICKDCKPILLQYDKEINRAVFDGHCFYFTVQNVCEIIKTDDSFHKIERFCTDREYDCICYDSTENCFWASSKKQFNVIYKLNPNMAEIDCITIEGLKAPGCITDISFNCCHNSLIVSYSTCIIEISKNCSITVILQSSSGLCITSVLSLCPVYIIIAAKNCQSYIYILDEHGQVLDSCSVDCKFTLKDIIFNPCQIECGKIFLNFWAIDEENCPHLCKWILPICDLKITLCPCNFLCRKKSCPEIRPCPKDPWTDILESIALMEASLAHILNAEGEKLQRVLCLTDDVDKILCINKEINKAIINATHLEHTLYAKLSTICECGLCDQKFSLCPPACKKKKEKSKDSLNW